MRHKRDFGIFLCFMSANYISDYSCLLPAKLNETPLLRAPAPHIPEPVIAVITQVFSTIKKRAHTSVWAQIVKKRESSKKLCRKHARGQITVTTITNNEYYRRVLQILRDSQCNFTSSGSRNTAEDTLFHCQSACHMLSI